MLEVTQGDFFTLILFIVTIIGAISGAWWRIESRVKEAKGEATLKADAAGAKADLVSSQLAEHKLHVAETYISKAGHRETTDQIMSAISSVTSAVEGTNQRIDRLFDERHGR